MITLRRASAAAGLGLMAVMLGLSSIPGDDLPDLGPNHADKLIHAAEYALLGLFLAAASPGARGAFLAGLIAALFGVLDEFYQGWIPGRSSSAWDAVADALGASSGAGAVALFRWRRSAVRPSSPSAEEHPDPPGPSGA